MQCRNEKEHNATKRCFTSFPANNKIIMQGVSDVVNMRTQRQQKEMDAEEKSRNAC